MQFEPQISVILPNFNGRKLLENNLPSIYAALELFQFEIIVVDDASSDDSCSYLAEAHPDIIVLTNSENKGFSATCNRGILESKAPLICIVNTDVTFDKDYFVNVVDYFNDSSLFAVKGDILNYKDSVENIESRERVVGFSQKRGLLRFNHHVVPDNDLFSGDLGGQFVLLGCCFVCARDKMIQLNGFNEIFSPFYWEDSDLPIRALRANYKIIYEGKAVVYHKTSSTIATYRSKTIRRLVSHRNKLMFAWFHLMGYRQWFNHIVFVLLSLSSRWLILDWKYYVSFSWACVRYLKWEKNEY